MKKVYLILLLISLHITLFSQDIHFSQFDASPLNLNPAQTSDINHDFRIVLNHRNQWQSVTVPYLTVSGSFEGKMHLLKNKLKGYWGYGLLINADKAGDGDFGTTQIKLSTAYHHPLKNKYLNTISVGMNIAYNYQSIDFTKFYFGNQFNGTYYNPNLPNDEVFQQNSISYIDFSTGLQLKGAINKTPFIFGLAYNHLNHPQQSFDNANIQLDGKLNTYLFSDFRITSANYLQPSVYYYQQGILKELSYGVLFLHKTPSIIIPTVFIGGWIRHKDAVIIKGGFDYKQFRIGLSYDINFSKLTVASQGRGGYEISIIYMFDKPAKIIIPYQHQCPVLM